MSSLFGEVWFWSLLAFLIGAVLTWVLLVRPAQQRVQQLERRPSTPAQRAPGTAQSEPGYPQPAPSEWPGGQAQGLVGEPEQQQAPPRTQWLERDSLRDHEGQFGVYPAEEEFFEREEQADAAALREGSDQGYRSAPVEEEPEGSLFESAEYPEYPEYTEYTQYLDRVESGEDAEQRQHGGGLDAALNPAAGSSTDERLDDRLDDSTYAPALDKFDELGHRPTAYDDLDTTTRAVGQQQTQDEAQESLGDLFAPTQRTPSGESSYAQPAEENLFEEQTPQEADAPQEEAAPEPPAGPDIDPATGLPKRRRGATSRIRGGFEPPRPIQPSVRPIARREPQAESISSGSLFEPSSDTGESAYAADAGQQAPPGRGTEGDRATVPAGPFGPGSAMPLPGGGRPAPSFTVKASVTALRYCTEDSPQFDRMVVEVWFASVADAERVGFRPLS